MRGLQAWSCSIGYRPGWAQRTGCEPRRALQAAIPAYLVAPPFFVEMHFHANTAFWAWAGQIRL